MAKRTAEVRPDEYFSSWAYDIPPAHWTTLGVERREYIDEAPTRQKREAAIAQGLDPRKATALKVMRKAYAVDSPPDHGFADGYTFAAKDRAHFLQIVSLRTDIEIEVHLVRNRMMRIAYVVTSTELADWLKSGDVPTHRRISPAHSYSDLHRFSILDPVAGDEAALPAPEPDRAPEPQA